MPEHDSALNDFYYADLITKHVACWETVEVISNRLSLRLKIGLVLFFPLFNNLFHNMESGQ